MSCEQYQERLYALADEELPDDRRAEVEAHLAICGSCRDELQLQRRLRGAVRQAFDVEQSATPSGLRQRVLDSLAAEPKPRKSRALPRWLGPIGLAAAAVLLVAVSAWVVTSKQTDDGILVPPGGQVAQGIAAADLIEVHRVCSNGEAAHHHPLLPTEQAAVGPAMQPKLGCPVAAPNLRERGFNFESANFCKVGGEISAHLVYRGSPQAHAGVPLSLFTFRGQRDLAAPTGSSVQIIDGLRVAQVDATAVIGIPGEQATVFVVGQVPPDEALELAKPVGLARGGPDGGVVGLSMVDYGSGRKVAMPAPGGVPTWPARGENADRSCGLPGATAGFRVERGPRLRAAP